MGWDGWVVVIDSQDGRQLWTVWSDDKTSISKWATREFNRYSRAADNPKWTLLKIEAKEFLRRMPKGHLVVGGRVFAFEENRTLAGALG